MSFARHRLSALLRIPPRSQLHTSAILAARGGRPRAPEAQSESAFDIFSEEDLTEPTEGDHTTSAGHLKLQQQRHLLYYMRLIEHEIPKLVAFRKPFVPPTSLQPLVIRSVSYGGEEHPVTSKRAVVVPVARLPLKDEAAIHKFKLLSGVRWSTEPPRGSGLTVEEGGGEHGYVKVSCEDFPKPAMNFKWASDTLDRLLYEANHGDTFADVPLDTRHLDAKARKGGKGEHARGRGSIRPSLKDFPKEWLPVSSPEAATFPPQ